MGLDADVMCRCLADGKVTLPKFAKRVKIDEDGCLWLDLPSGENDGLQMRFHQWKQTACAHPKMTIAREHIASWTGYRSFQQALEIGGWQHFPTLKAELPQNNGGLTPADAAAKMLEEIDYFVEQAQLGWTTELVDSATGQRLHEHIEAYAGEFMYGADGINMGVDQLGFFIRRRDDIVRPELFRSMRFSQTRIDLSASGSRREYTIEFVDLETGQAFRCKDGVSMWAPWPDGTMQNVDGQCNFVLPEQMHVAPHQRSASEYDHILSPLRAVCRASVETGNPIRWC